MTQRSRILIPTIAIAFSTVALASAGTCGEARAEEKRAERRCSQSAESCLSSLSAKLAARGWVGVETEKDEHGNNVVTRVATGSPAAVAGLHGGDVLVALNGVELTGANRDALQSVKKTMTPGANVEYTVNRRSGQQLMAVTLGEVPREILAQWVGEHMLDQHAYVASAAP